ncbi:hypothetical protein SALBM217S_06256 [Streptomyces griseoloalbus]
MYVTVDRVHHQGGAAAVESLTTVLAAPHWQPGLHGAAPGASGTPRGRRRPPPGAPRPARAVQPGRIKHELRELTPRFESRPDDHHLVPVQGPVRNEGPAAIDDVIDSIQHLADVITRVDLVHEWPECAALSLLLHPHSSHSTDQAPTPARTRRWPIRAPPGCGSPAAPHLGASAIAKSAHAESVAGTRTTHGADRIVRTRAATLGRNRAGALRCGSVVSRLGSKSLRDGPRRGFAVSLAYHTAITNGAAALRPEGSDLRFHARAGLAWTPLDGLYNLCQGSMISAHSGCTLTPEPICRRAAWESAAWAKVLAAFGVPRLTPLVIWFLVSFPKSGAFPW